MNLNILKNLGYRSYNFCVEMKKNIKDPKIEVSGK